MGYFIDNMMDADKIKYKERSICAINGIRQLISDIQLILSCNTIKGKYYQIAQYIGLATENEKSYYNYFIPINSDIVFLLRFSDHNNTNPSLYNQHERNGRPNKRFIIPFVGNIFQNSGPTPFLGAEHHVVSYPVNALDDEASIKLFLSDLQRLFTNGETNFTQLPQQPIQENNNKQINTNKNIMKINESQLRKIIKESIKNTLNEMDFFDNANTKPQKEMSIWPETGDINIGGQLDMRKVMDFIQKNGLNGQTSFNFNNGRIITSLYAEGDKVEKCLEIYPIEEWNDYNGMKCIQRRGMKSMYMFYINGIIYFVSVHFN